ncbi:glycerate kinase [Arthrobacter zhaoxinii]|uniref:Glycerate kinase n=1 Tax=Arthrobacter zhaoxinii TaxID=2964616 RepID=A0ABY5YSZ6_9MICC|nr:glycerate kinase [Arthrobacter zhaoxinii]UWX97198.1 glycerate kinase [Arthrobacter zhaoxinii]
MRVVIAPDKFKGTLSSVEAAAAMGEGVLAVYPDAVVTAVPVADGGEGTLDAALTAGAQPRTARVRGPLGRDVTAVWALEGHTALIETARASGLALLEPTPGTALDATSYGSGQLIGEALDAGARTIILGIGGSAMTDGGSGALAALGLKILDRDGVPVPPGGAGLMHAASLDAAGLDPRLAEVDLRIAADVTNPLLGRVGTVAVFSGQKGAGPAEMPVLEAALTNWAELLKSTTGVDVDVPGAGAAGGFPSGFLAFTGASLNPGFELLSAFTGLDAALTRCDLVLTGEGSLDEQSRYGKAPLAVAARARDAGIPVVAVAGRITLTPDQLEEYGIVAAVSLLDVVQRPQDAMEQAAKYVAQATRQVLEGA